MSQVVFNLWSQEVQAWVGVWAGEFQKVTATWLRFYTEAGQLVLTTGKAEAAEAEAARLRALLAKHNIAANEDVTAGEYFASFLI